MSVPDPEVREGTIAPLLAAELPGLRLVFTEVAARPSRSPASLERRLRRLSDGPRGGGVVAMRTQAIPQAYRTLFRHIGLDPDVTRPPAEQAAVERLLAGEHRSRGLPHDALLVAVLETGVGTWALDADHVESSAFGIRLSGPGEEMLLDGVVRELPAGRVVVGDDRRVHGLLFGEQSERAAVGPRTERMLLYAVGVDGVPDIHLHEALWTAAELLS